jgi:hypothetical protein
MNRSRRSPTRMTGIESRERPSAHWLAVQLARTSVIATLRRLWGPPQAR